MTYFIDEKKEYRLWIDQDTDKPSALVHIDCGHGGIVKGIYQTAGKQFDFGEFQFYEGVYTRQIGKALSQKLFNNHISYNFTTISNYDESLSKRIEYLSHVIHTYNKHKHILISIHGNAAGVESAHGVEIWTTHGITDSDYAANFMIPYLYDLGMRVRINRAKENEYDKEENWYIIRKAEALGCIAILGEYGFYTNREEALKMMDGEFQGTVVNSIYKGLRDIITKIQTNGTIR